jgi:hypothetical protein
MNPRTQESTADTNATLPDCVLPQSTTQPGSSGAGVPGSNGRKYTPEQLRQKLLDLGGRDATLDPTTPRAFELPASMKQTDCAIEIAEKPKSPLALETGIQPPMKRKRISAA